jgi:hypothetical protein
MIRTGLLSLIGFLYLFSACNSVPIEYHYIPLEHGLGSIQIRDNDFFDTTYHWIHELDCDCCHLSKYRLSDARFPVLMENSWKYAQPDSMLQLTVLQPENPSCDTSFRVDYMEMRNQIKYINGQYWGDPYWVYSRIKKIDGYDFMILGWEIEQYPRYNNQNVQELLAITSIDGEKVTLDFSCRRGDCGNFLRRSFWLLENMKIHRSP